LQLLFSYFPYLYGLGILVSALPTESSFQVCGLWHHVSSPFCLPLKLVILKADRQTGGRVSQ